MPAGTITSKGQITIPLEIREHLQLRKGQRVEFQLDAKGRVILEPLTADFRRLKGSVRSSRKRAPSLAEINRAIAEGYAGR